MAKGLRSSRKKLNKIAKRERYALKERAKLEKIVELAKQTAAEQPLKDVYKQLFKPKEEPLENPNEEIKMAVDGEAPAAEVGTDDKEEDDDESHLPMGVAPPTEHGNYPTWMSSKAIKRAKKHAKKRRRAETISKRRMCRPWRR